MTGSGYLFDTNVVSWLSDGMNPLHNWAMIRAKALGDAPVFIAAMTLAEVEFGFAVNPVMDEARRIAVRAAMDGYTVLPINKSLLYRYASIRAELFTRHAPLTARGRLKKRYVEDLIDRTSGKELGIQENDIWIVATAVEYNLDLVTADRAGGMGRIIAAADYASQCHYWVPPAP